jgi:hypothetical protein
VAQDFQMAVEIAVVDPAATEAISETEMQADSQGGIQKSRDRRFVVNAISIAPRASLVSADPGIKSEVDPMLNGPVEPRQEKTNARTLRPTIQG